MQDTAMETLAALEQRLQRLNFLLHGDPVITGSDDTSPADRSASIASRLHNLEKSLQAVAAQSASADELLRLQKKHPDLWDEPSISEETDDMPDDALSALVLAHMPSYHTTAAQLTSLNDLPVPDASSSAALLSLEPRIQSLRERQQRQEKVISHLRQQSVALIGRWYEVGIVSMGDCWSEWDARLMDTERTVRRAEGRKKREEEAV